MLGYSSNEHTEDGTRYFQVRGYYEYIENDLWEEIENRCTSNKYFTGDELMKLFTSFVSA